MCFPPRHQFEAPCRTTTPRWRKHASESTLSLRKARLQRKFAAQGQRLKLKGKQCNTLPSTGLLTADGEARLHARLYVEHTRNDLNSDSPHEYVIDNAIHLAPGRNTCM